MCTPSYGAKGVTLSLLWQEYREVHTDGYGYSRYCELYTRWEGKLSPVMGVVARIGCQVLTQAFATTTDMLNAA